VLEAGHLLGNLDTLDLGQLPPPPFIISYGVFKWVFDEGTDESGLNLKFPASTDRNPIEKIARQKKESP
jgi:hypothetical protein